MNNLPVPISQVSEDESLTIRFSAIVQEARKITEELDPIVERWEGRSSEFLFGMVGGLSLGLLTFLIMYFYVIAAASIVLSVTAVGLLIGILIPLILFRGFTQWRVEKNIRQMRIKLASLRAEIQELDGMQSVPRYIREEMWGIYRETLSSFREAEAVALRRQLYGRRQDTNVNG